MEACPERQRGKRNPLEQIRVELLARRISFFESCLSACPTDLWGCDCNALSGEGSPKEDYKWQAVAHYHRPSRRARESQAGRETQAERAVHRNVDRSERHARP